MGLLDQIRSGFQGASNSVAGNVSAPVDGINWLLRKAGLPVSDKPFMGSDWMAAQGLTATPQNHLAGLLGETAGMLAPFAPAKKIAGGLLSLDDKAMDMARRGVESHMVNSGMIQPATVWHGSPHKFDKFDASKIGTGEGAQAYGHGLYLAESPDVAKSYQKTLTAENGFLLDGKKMTRAEVQDALNAERSGYLDGVTRPSGVADYHMDALANASFGKPKRFADGTERGSYWKSLQGRLSKEDHGSLYKVDLPDNAIAKMLDWDKPLSQQAPEVQKMLEPLGYSSKAKVSQYDDDLLAALNGNAPAPLQTIRDPMGSDIARGGGLFDSKAQIDKAKRLRELGIPGIRYLDGGSRGTGGGTSNYVVFPGQEDILKILERNGVPTK